IVGTNPTVRPATRSRSSAARNESTVAWTWGTSALLGERSGQAVVVDQPAGGSREGEVRLALGRVDGGEVPGDGVPIAPSHGAGEGAGRSDFGHVLQRAGSEVEVRLAGHTDAPGDAVHLAHEGHQVVRRHDRGGVVGGAILVAHLEPPAT